MILKKIYLSIKMKIDLLILNKDNEITKSMIDEAKGKVTYFSIKEDMEQGALF